MPIGNTHYVFPSDNPFISEQFQLENDFGQVSISGMQEGDQVCVEIYSGSECDGQWIPYNPSCCGQMCICYPQNLIFLGIPNKYRLIFSNANNTDNDETWFEGVTAYFQPLSSNIDIANFINEGCCSMPGCGLTRDEVLDMIRANLPDDVYVSSTDAVAEGYTIRLTNGDVFTLPVESSDNTVNYSAGDFTINPEAVAEAICNNLAARDTLAACIGEPDNIEDHTLELDNGQLVSTIITEQNQYQDSVELDELVCSGIGAITDNNNYVGG